MRCGVDIQNIQEFQAQVNKVGDAFVQEIFFPEEIAGLPLVSIVGRFCVKEALVKVGLIEAGEWKRVKLVTKTPGLKPNLESADSNLVIPAGLDFSISHSGDFAIGMVVVG
jgi:phosphopantetheinyl transferase (holo-ACP synthase)